MDICSTHTLYRSLWMNFSINASIDYYNCNVLKFVDFEQDFALTIIFSILTVLSLYWILLGFRYLRLGLMSVVYVVSASSVYYLLLGCFMFPVWLNVTITMLTAISLAVLAMFVKRIGFFLIGLYSGWATAICVMFLVTVFVQDFAFYYLIIPFAILGLLGGIFTSAKPYYYGIFSFCNFGGFTLFLCLDFFLVNKMLQTYMIQVFYNTQNIIQPCWYAWLFMISWLLSLVVGCFIQHYLTGVETLERNAPKINIIHGPHIFRESALEGDIRDRAALV